MTAEKEDHMHPAVQRLAQMLPPPSAGVDTLPWDDIEARWGTAFPRDYRDFMNVYGAGGIDGIIAVATPENRDEPGYLTVRLMTPTVASEHWTFYGKRHFPAWPAPGSLLGWGVTPVGYDLMWRVSGGDPDDWPVVLVGYREGAAYEYPFGMAEFLARMLGDPADRPADLPGVLGHPHSRFMPAREEYAALAAGQDPTEYVDRFLAQRERERAEQGPVTWISGPGRPTYDLPDTPHDDRGVRGGR